ncbi:hypothetical protein PybrP1_012888 [[Pythium] brassicae (nom. inval.)]|nr:hypothetical protein PybrP1_012888 [[Pythium] brassicae (nom. inval.)]
MSAKSKPSSGRSSLSSRSGSRSSTVGEYLPSLENQKLPVVLNDKSRQGKLDPTPASTGLLDSPGLASSRNPSMSSTRSDSELHAPRRLNAVPSSADRNALDFYDHEDDTDDGRSDGDERLAATVSRARSSPPDLGTFTLSNALVMNKLGSSKSAGLLSEASQSAPDDSSLLKKFEDLKQLMSSKKAKKALLSHSQANAQASSSKTSSKSREHSTSLNPNVARTAAEKGARSTVLNNAKSVVVEGSRKASGAVVAASVPVVVKTLPIRSKKEMKIRNGVSLSDLKEEHRAALAMLRELGGPMDVNYDSLDAVEERPSALPKAGRASRSSSITKGAAGLTTHPRLPKSSASSVGSDKFGAHKSPPPTASGSPHTQTRTAKHELEAPPSSSPVGSAGGSLVTKLRSSVPSGRAKTPELVEQAVVTQTNDGASLQEPAQLAPETSVAMFDVDVRATAPAATLASVVRQERSLENVAEVDDEDDDPDVALAVHSKHVPEIQQPATDDELWRQYDEDGNAAEHDDGDSDATPEEDERFESEADGGSAPMTARSVDLYGDEGFESEW